MPRRRRHGTDEVQPDLPITPMLDMSFQLLAFFIMTFNPVPTEGQLAMSLPPPDQGGGGAPPPIQDEKPMKWAVVVAAADNGQIAKMTLREEGSPDERGEDLGASVAAGLLPRLKTLAEAEQRRIAAAAADKRTVPPPKLTLEIGDKLLHGFVVQLMDAAVQAGFTDIAPVPIDKKSR